MLSKIWNEYVVRPCQCVAQEVDRGAVDYQNAVIEDAKKGVKRGVHSTMYLAVPYEEKLSPEKAAEVIKEAEALRARAQARLQQRHEKFGFKL